VVQPGLDIREVPQGSPVGKITVAVDMSSVAGVTVGWQTLVGRYLVAAMEPGEEHALG